ncbi:MAG: hypothetical protein AB1599_05430 [Planctomycetota bacterium]
MHKKRSKNARKQGKNEQKPKFAGNIRESRRLIIYERLKELQKQIAGLILDYQRLERLLRRRERFLEELRARTSIQVFDETTPEGHPRYPDDERRKSEVVCRLVDNPAYRNAVNSIERIRMKLGRLKSQETLLQAEVKQIEATDYTDRH